jgi:ATP-dependent Clp protease ATP-binding subunit ClpC
MAMPRFLDSIRFALRFSSRGFTDQSVNALLAARKHAVERRLHDITPEHILLGVAALPRCVARVALVNLGLDLGREAMAVTAFADARPPGQSSGPPTLAPETERLLIRAEAQARELGLNYVGTEHLVMGLLRGAGPAAEYLRERGVTPDRYLSALEGLFAGPSEPPRSNQPAE